MDNRTHNHWFLTIQVEKIGVLHVILSDEGPYDKNNKPSNPPSLPPTAPIVIISIPYLNHHKNPHSPGSQLLNLIFILSLAFSYFINAPLHQYVYKYSPPTI